MTDDEIKALLNSFFETQAHTTYVGSRYVPTFGRKGSQVVDWDNKAPYEPLTIVLHEGNSFTSRCYVPADIDITNANFWVETGNFNAQVAAYREEVRTYDDRIKENKTNIVAETTRATAADTALDDKITNETARATTADATITNGYKDADAQIVNDYKEADTELNNTINNFINPISNKFPIKAEDIANGAVTKEKLDAQSIESIVRGIAIRRFNSANSTADNGNMTVGANTVVRGFYIPELTMLVLDHLEVIRGTLFVSLPDYIPKPNGPCGLGTLLSYTDTTPFSNWYNLVLQTNGSITISSTDSASYNLMGTSITFLRPYGAF